MCLLLQWAWSAAETLGSDKLLFYYLTFFFFRRREQKHWNSGERQKEIQRAEKQVSSQSNILTYDLGGAECWTWRSLCNHCRLHWYSYNVTNCKSSGKGKQAASILFIHGNIQIMSWATAFLDQHELKCQICWVFFYVGRKPERLEEAHTNTGRTCELLIGRCWPWWRLKHRPSLLSITNTAAYPAIMDVVVLDSS